MQTRYRLVDKRRFFTFLALCIMILCFAVMIVNAGAASPESRSYDTVRVKKGDTLWGIASSRCDGDIRSYIYQIKQINRLGNDIIHEGQLLLIP
jgi:hypothetical protein